MYDYCIMNPPYSGTTHLKFLEKTIEIANNVISIQPCGWLMDIPAVMGFKTTNFQKYSDSIGKHIKLLDIFSADEINKYFGIFGFEKVGIYVLDNNDHDIYLNAYLKDNRKSISIFNKVIKPTFEGKYKNIGDYIKISGIHGHPGAKDEFDIVTPKYDLIKDKRPENMSESEFINWHNSCNTKFMKYCNLLTRQGQNLKLGLIPLMNDYSEPWDDKRFYKFFNLSNEEISLIEKTMEKYIY